MKSYTVLHPKLASSIHSKLDEMNVVNRAFRVLDEELPFGVIPCYINEDGEFEIGDAVCIEADLPREDIARLAEDLTFYENGKTGIASDWEGPYYTYLGSRTSVNVELSPEEIHFEKKLVFTPMVPAAAMEINGWLNRHEIPHFLFDPRRDILPPEEFCGSRTIANKRGHRSFIIASRLSKKTLSILEDKIGATSSIIVD